MSQRRVIFFDLDGTLLDTSLDLVGSLNQLLQENNKKSVRLNEMRPWISQGANAMIKKAFSIDDNHAYFDEYRNRFLQIYEQRLAQETRLFKHMDRILEFLDENGYSWGIITNKQERFSIPLLKQLKLFERTCCIVCGDTTPYIKPHPAPLLHACELTRISPKQAIYIGDSEKDIIAGKAAGMETIAVSYGYIDSNPNHWNADYVVNDCYELLDCLSTQFLMQ